MPAAGAAFVARKIDAIAANPDVWDKTALIINYDENDGLFDHVAAADAAAGHARGIRARACRSVAGFRVPCIIVSPWTAGGWVCSERFDHTSVLRFLEKFTGVANRTSRAWRRKTFGDMTSVLRFHHKPGQPPKLPNAHALLAKAQHDSNICRNRRLTTREVDAGSGKATLLTTESGRNVRDTARHSSGAKCCTEGGSHDLTRYYSRDNFA